MKRKLTVLFVGIMTVFSASSVEVDVDKYNHPYKEVNAESMVLITTDGFEDASVENKAYISKYKIYLNILGYNAGKVDGEFTEQTKGAIRAYQKDRDIADDGQISDSLFEMLKKDADSFFQ